MNYEKMFVLHLKKEPKFISYKDECEIFDEIITNKNIITEIKKNIYINDNILYDLQKANESNIDKNLEEYKSLKDRIINVGEYKMTI